MNNDITSGEEKSPLSATKAALENCANEVMGLMSDIDRNETKLQGPKVKIIWRVKPEHRTGSEVSTGRISQVRNTRHLGW